MSPRNRAYLAVTAFKNAWTGINILVVVTIFNWLPLIANKLIFLNSQFIFQESSDVTTRVKFSQKAPPFKFIQQLFWFSLGHNKNNQAKNSEGQASRVDTPMGQCVGEDVDIQKSDENIYDQYGKEMKKTSAQMHDDVVSKLKRICCWLPRPTATLKIKKVSNPSKQILVSWKPEIVNNNSCLSRFWPRLLFRMLLIKRVTNNAEHIVTHATMLLTTSQGLGIKPSKRTMSQVTTQNMLLTWLLPTHYNQGCWFAEPVDPRSDKLGAS